MTLVAAVVVSAGLATPAAAGRQAFCNPGKELLRIEQKTCPARKTLPPIVLERACCLHKDGTTHCRQFPQCPRRSPS
jgi:hypothetical protein